MVAGGSMSKQITISAPRPAPSFTPLFVAIDKFVPEEGIEAQIQYGGRDSRERALNGEIDYVATAVGRGRFLQPTGLIFLAQHQARATSHTLMIRPEVGTADRISTVVMAGDGGEHNGLALELKSILAQHGVKLEEADISLHGVKGGHPDQFRALQEGIGDGAPVGSPWWLFLSKQGYVNLGCEADYSPGLGCNGVHTTAEKIKRDPEEVRAIVRSYIKAVRYCRKNVDGTIEVMLKYAKDWGVDTPETAREAYKWLAPYWSETIDPQVFQRLLNNAAEKYQTPAGSVDEVLDIRFYEEETQALNRS
jgi:ABC-type nitrate/sulfonate/bicarbonate transport system substrate-binding protein